ncbi:MAG: fatty acid desaturase CarF family protein [Vulcanimicrobiota bacterium]
MRVLSRSSRAASAPPKPVIASPKGKTKVAHKAGVTAFVAAGGLAVSKLALHVAHQPGVLPKVLAGAGVLATIGAGYAASDLITGHIHFGLDHFVNEDTPVLGNQADEFHYHHHDEKSLERHSLAANVGATAIPAAPALVGLAMLAPAGVAAAGLGLLSGFVVTQASHRWSHQDNPNRLIRGLQRAHVLMPPENHDQHHSGKWNDYFCVVNGMFNPILSKTGYWRKLESGLEKVTGKQANWKDPSYFETPSSPPKGWLKAGERPAARGTKAE